MIRSLPFLSLVAAAALATGCASTRPPSGPHAAEDCNHLRVEIARTADERRAGVEKRDDAWKVVIPFAVVAQYMAGKSAVDAADQRLAELGEQSRRKGCAS